MLCGEDWLDSGGLTTRAKLQRKDGLGIFRPGPSKFVEPHPKHGLRIFRVGASMFVEPASRAASLLLIGLPASTARLTFSIFLHYPSTSCHFLS